eukprot:TRINITY_DN72051_c0_g1_i1.p1 TRINITY_DN72051_c0_g1~~TRINITY_DN72051_c0_g1_i1.p1  ORF type:complete len:341 (+),score=76.00 TRINITY_DN72051_c0_g1_i1:85-1023(+)
MPAGSGTPGRTQQPRPKSAGASGRSRVCRHYLQGRCTAGPNCKFVHNGEKGLPYAQRQVPQLKECCNAVISQRCKFGKRGNACCFMHLDTLLSGTGGSLAALGALALPPLQDPQLEALGSFLSSAVRSLGDAKLRDVLAQTRAVPGCDCDVDPDPSSDQIKAAVHAQLSAGPFSARLRQTFASSAGPAPSAESKGPVLKLCYTILCPTGEEKPIAALPVAAPVVPGAEKTQNSCRSPVPSYSPVSPTGGPRLPAATKVMPTSSPSPVPVWPSMVGTYLGAFQCNTQGDGKAANGSDEKLRYAALRELEFLGI